MIIAALLGVLTWSLMEYLIHRFLGHEVKTRPNPFATEHVRHHSEGNYFAHWWKKVLAATAFFAVVAPLAVWLVGAGPGDPDMLTLKGLRVLQGADVVVHDGLVSDEILRLAPETARRISVAKRKSRHSCSQDEISRMLTAFALEGLAVVRLKGGDPFIFGRGGEELEACRAAGVDCQVVPGVTAALAAGASAGARSKLAHPVVSVPTSVATARWRALRTLSGGASFVPQVVRRQISLQLRSRPIDPPESVIQTAK